MKKILYILIFSAAATATACNEWLDVSPRMEVKQEDQFSSEDGFRTALIGAYIKLAGTGLYGKNTSYYFPEVLARTWTLKSNSSEYAEQTALEIWNFSDSRVESRIAQIWKDYYYVIVHLNAILDNIDSADVGMSTGAYNVIKGEAHGLRAFLHLEILRLFGPMPKTATPADKAIPYVTKMTKQVGALLSVSWAEVIEGIEKDLELSKDYLGQSDPILYAGNPQLNYVLPFEGGDTPADEWFYYRQRRFNYYAAIGTEARLYHWIGNKEKAAAAARLVIESGKYRLTTNADFISRPSDYPQPLTMSSEHLFGLHNQNLPTIINGPFVSSEPLFTQTRSNVNKAFDSNTGDTRLGTSRYWEDVTHAGTGNVTHFRKYGGNPAIETNYLIPLLRLAEMYLILIEDLPFDDGRSYMREYVNARNLPESLMSETESQLAARLEKEWRKEFFGEGQMFFFYKLHGYAKYTWPASYTLPAGGMVVPIPESQTVWDDGTIVMD